MTYRGLAVCVVLSACVVPESGNPAARCNDQSSCASDQVCYRGFCVEDESQSTTDAGSPLNEPVAEVAEDAAIVSDGDTPTPSDAAVVDGSAEVGPGPDAADASAGAVGLRDAGLRDAGLRDAAAPEDGLLPCLKVCRRAKFDERKCKKCIEDSFGQSPEQLCGKASKADDDDDDQDSSEMALEPVCLSLCIGAASVSPGCRGEP